MPAFKRAKRRNRARSPSKIPIICLAVKDSLLAYSLEGVELGVERISRTRILERLEREAQSLRREADRIRDRRKKNVTFNRYLKLISRIEEIKKSTSIELMRYE